MPEHDIIWLTTAPFKWTRFYFLPRTLPRDNNSRHTNAFYFYIGNVYKLRGNLDVRKTGWKSGATTSTTEEGNAGQLRRPLVPILLHTKQPRNGTIRCNNATWNIRISWHVTFRGEATKAPQLFPVTTLRSGRYRCSDTPAVHQTAFLKTRHERAGLSTTDGNIGN